MTIIGLQDERVLVDDEYTVNDYPDFTVLCEATHGYPATALQWQPASNAKRQNVELLATTGDSLRIWEYGSSDGPQNMGQYVGQQPVRSSGHTLQVKSSLSGVSAHFNFFSKRPSHMRYWTL